MTSLVTEVVYRQRTRDLTSESGDVLAALDDAQGELEERLRRPLAYGTYTEERQLYQGLKVYPKVIPLDPATTGYHDSATLHISSIVDFVDVLLYPQLRPENYGYPRPRRALVTYQGGWTAQTLPRRLRDAICFIAQDNLGGDDDGLEAGLTAMKVGDLSLTFKEPTTGWRSGLWETVRGYAYRELACT